MNEAAATPAALRIACSRCGGSGRAIFVMAASRCASCGGTGEAKRTPARIAKEIAAEAAVLAEITEEGLRVKGRPVPYDDDAAKLVRLRGMYRVSSARLAALRAL